MKKIGKQSRRYLSSTLSALVILTVMMPNNSYNTVLADELEKSLNKVTIKNLDKVARDDLYFKYENPYEVVRVIVELEEPAAIEKAKEQGEKRPSKENVQEVKENQKDVKKEAEEITGEQVNESFGTLINGFSIDTKMKDIEELKKLDGVKRVKVVKKYYPAMTSAKELTQAKNVWSDLGLKGEGMVVSIIDSGIDPNHKDMKISDHSNIKLKEENVKEGPGKYYTEKIPYGYNFADDNDNIIDTHPKVSMHGMHVAGIVAANGNDEEVDKNEAIKGVAPEAQLLAMKVFSNNPNRNGASEDDIVAAIEESVNQGADIINMSLGSSAGFQQENDPEQIAVKKAVDAGIVVVVAAGNSQYSTAPYKVPDIKDTGLVGAPGTAKDALTVANYQNNKMPLTSIKITSKDETYNIPFMISDEKNNVNTSEEYEIVDCGLGNENDFSGKDLKGKIALIKRGSISFVDKTINAQSAGASGVIIYNEDGQEGFVSMSTSPMVKIPSVFIRNSDGKRLMKLINKDIKANFTNNKILVESSEAGDFVESSSWGPTPSLDFKPQISAPGGNIYSTLNDSRYGIKTGTSMASPHVAGGEALIVEGLKKENPNLKGRDLVELAKNTSISTSQIIMDKYNDEIPYSPRRQGAGVMQIEEALKNKVVVTDEHNNPTVALKQIGNEKEFTLKLRNYDNEPIEYKVENFGGVLTETSEDLRTMSHDIKIEGAKVTFDKNNIVVPANGETSVKVNLTIPKSVSEDRFIEGFIKFTSKDKPSLSVPFIGYYGEWGKEQIIEAMDWDKDNQKFIVPSGVLTNLNGKIGYKLGLSERDSNEKLQINPENIAISPNDDGNGDIIAPYLYYLRNSRVTEVDLLDENKKSLGVIGRENYTRKEEYSEPSGSGKTPNLFNNLSWDGKLYNPATGKKEAVKEGQYYLNIKSKVDYDNAQYQSLIVPVKVDVTAPTINLLSEEKILTNDDLKEVDYKLQWEVSDNVAIIPGIVNININGKDVQADVEENDGIYSCNVKLKANFVNNIKVAMNDTAFNVGEASKNVKVESSKARINFEDNFEKSSLEISNVKEYVVKGTVLGTVKEFKLNGEKVQINEDGTFAHKINLNEGYNKINIYAKDDNGNELYNYATKIFCDVTSPNINLSSPEIESDGIVITNQDSILVKGTVEDNTIGYKFYKNDVMEIDVINGEEIGNDNTRREFNYEIPVKDGEFISLKAVDLLGHETIKKFKVKVDKDLPKIVVDGITDDGLYNKDILPKVTSDKDVKVTYLLDGEEYNGKSPISSEGKHTLKINILDKAGNKLEKEVNFEIDKTPLNIIFTNLENDKLYNKELKPEINSSEEVATIKYTLNGKDYDGETPIKEEGTYNLKVLATDKAGNISESEINFGIDVTPVEFLVSGVEDGKVYNQSVNPVIDVDDKVAIVNYTLNGEKYDGISAIDKDGEYNLILTAVDKAGNHSEKNINFTITRLSKNELDSENKNNNKYNEPTEMVVNKIKTLSDTPEEIKANNKKEKLKGEKIKAQKNKLFLPNTGRVIGSSVLGLLGIIITSAGVKLSKRKNKDN